MMFLQRYQQEASRTLIKSPPRTYTAQEHMLFWCALGLAGEAGEILDVVNGTTGTNQDMLVKELGDVSWYIAALCTIADIEMQHIHVIDQEYGTLSSLATRLNIATAKVVEYIKKSIFHDHGFDRERFVGLLSAVWVLVVAICEKTEQDIPTMLDLNIEKLQKRYPSGFSSVSSLAREDVQVES